MESAQDRELLAANQRLLEQRVSQGVMTAPIKLKNTETLTEIMGRIQESPYVELKEPPAEVEVKVLLKYCGVAPRHQGCSFDNFKGNARLIADLQKSTDSLFMTGKTGCGKTHLAVSVLREAKVVDSRGGYFITVPEMLMKIRATFSGKSEETEEEIVKRFSDYEVLVLDDLGSEKTTEYSITTLFLILDRRDRYLKRTIVTSNLSLKEIEDTLGARIASRLAGMNPITIKMPDYRKG